MAINCYRASSNLAIQLLSSVNQTVNESRKRHTEKGDKLVKIQTKPHAIK